LKYLGKGATNKTVLDEEIELYVQKIIGIIQTKNITT